jgi:uncharacterized SAM-binding protein YcdF (DUF218 family)
MADLLFLLKKLLSALLLPPTGLILLGLLGLLLAGRRPRLGRALAGLSLLGLLALSLPPVAVALMAGLEPRVSVLAGDLDRAQAIVVLGGGNYYGAPEYGGADTVGRYTLERIRYGARLQRQTGLPLLVTGGAPMGGRPEGEAMKEALERDFGVPVAWVEAASRDTAENAAYSAPLLRQAGITRIALVSHAWHQRRAGALFERQGFEVIAAPMAFTTPAPRPALAPLPSLDRKSTRLNSSHNPASRMPSSA